MCIRDSLKDVIHDVEQKALVSLDKAVDYTLQDKIVDGKLYVEQGTVSYTHLDVYKRQALR